MLGGSPLPGGFFLWPLSQSVLIPYLVPIGRNQPFKRMPGQKYRNDDTLGRPVLSGKSVQKYTAQG